MNQKILSRIFWLLALILVTFLGDRVGGWLCQKVVADSGFRYSRLYEGERHTGSDILLLGNSRGLGLYQPAIEEITGKNTFNLSYNGMTMDLAKVLVEDYYDRYEAPERLVIDITICDRSSPEMLASFVPYFSYSKRYQQLIQDTSAIVANTARLSHLYRYNSEIFQRALYYHNGRSDSDWLLDRAMSESTLEYLEAQKYRIDAHFVPELKSVIELAESKGTKVELVIIPYFPPYVKVMKGLEVFQKDIEMGTGRRVQDYSLAVDNPNCYGDFQHLNKKGSRVFVQLLKKDGVL